MLPPSDCRDAYIPAAAVAMEYMMKGGRRGRGKEGGGGGGRRERGKEGEGEGGGRREEGGGGRKRRRGKEMRITNTSLHFTTNYNSSLPFSTPTPTHTLLHIKQPPQMPSLPSPSSLLPPYTYLKLFPKASLPIHVRVLLL